MTIDLHKLSTTELERAFHKLVGHFGLPAKITMAGWIWGVEHATRGWTEFEFRVAVKDAAATCTYFPKAKNIRENRPITEKTPQVEAGPQRDECQSCGKHRYYAGFRCPNGEVHPRLRCDCPQSSTRWDHPDAVRWSEDKAEMVAAGYSRSVHAGRAR